MQVIDDKINVPAEVATFARLEEDGVTVQITELPIGKNINDGTGALYWINRGFTPIAEWESKAHAAEVKKQQEAEAKKAEAKKAEKSK